MSIGFTPRIVKNEQELKHFLNEFPNIHPETWIKSISSLYTEIKNGECILGIENGKLHRRVDVVAIKCFHTTENGERFQIFEDKQVFKNGSVRQRGFKYVAEKLQAGEIPEQAAVRGLDEELKISGLDVHPIFEETILMREESKSYKGIESSYKTHYFSCEIVKEHYKESYIEEQDDKTTFFSWVHC